MIIKIIPYSFMVVLAFSASSLAQETTAPTGIANEANTTLQSITGGNEFTFEGGAPMAPGLPSFAGGPCTGASVGASTSLAGIAIGGGKTSVDDSCQRRNWVQTLIGASQHMPEQEKIALLRVAVEVMKYDPYLKEAFSGLGYTQLDVLAAEDADKKLALASMSSEQAQPELKTPKFAESCKIVAAGNIDKLVIAAIETKGCSVTLRGGSTNVQ